MPVHETSYGELISMPLEDLRKEIVTQRALISKMRLSIQLNKEKDTAKFRRERRVLARMLLAYERVGKKKMGAKKEDTKVLKRKPKTDNLPVSKS